MATVRNIRNLLLSGISANHVVKVCKYICNEVAVSRGKMFPFQYFTAYDVLNEIKEIKENKKDRRIPKKRPDEDKEKAKWMIEKEKKREEMIESINLKHVEAVQKALDKAVNIAARRNIPPLKGTTLVLCGYSLDMMERFSQAKGISQRGANVRDTAALFSLMTQQAAEDSRLVLFSSNFMTVELGSSDLLENVDFIKTNTDINKKIGLHNMGPGAKAAIEEYLEAEQWLDNIILFHAGLQHYEEGVLEAVNMFRKLVNKNCLLANVNICGNPSQALDEESFHPNDLKIYGFSDAVFNMIINKGNGGQLRHVENIDKKYNLVKLPSPLTDNKLARESMMMMRGMEVPVWQTVRVFISSTFLDMQPERQLLHNFVLPQLQRLAASQHVSVDLVDLRWGLTQAGIQSRSQARILRQG